MQEEHPPFDIIKLDGNYAKTRKFCSRVCMGISKRKRTDIACLICGNRFSINQAALGTRLCCSLISARNAIGKSAGQRAWQKG